MAQPFMNGNYYNPYQPQVQQPMDRLTQLQAQQYQVPQIQQPTQTNQGLLWVQGEAAARSYLVAPSTTVLLMDSESQVFYLKSTDGSGMPLPLRIFDYTERTTQQSIPKVARQSLENEQMDLDDRYVTREEYNHLQARCAEIVDELDIFRASMVVSNDTRKSATTTNKSRSKGGDSNE